MSRYQNLDAEQAILIALLAWPEAFDQIADTVSAADFSAINREIFAACQSLVLAGKPVDAITVHHAVNSSSGKVPVPIEDFNWLAMPQHEVRRGGMRRYAEIVRAASLERRLMTAVQEAADIVEGEGEFADRLERATALLSALGNNQGRRGPRLMADLLGSRIDHYTALGEGEKVSAWPTRIPTLDRLLSGGLRPGKVYILGARPKVGKTSLAAQIVLNCARHEDVAALVLSQEMPEDEVVDRAISNLGVVDYGSLQTGNFPKGGQESSDFWGQLCEAVEIGRKLPVYIDDQAGLTLADIRAKARSIKGLKVLVLDYLQLCSGNAGKRGDANRNSEIEQISRGVKVLAKELGIAVLMLSQLNRDVEKRLDKRPHLADLRDSGSIEQDADAVIFLWPAREFDQDGHRLIGCAVEANRSGPMGEFALDFQGKYQRWGESDQPVKFEPKSAVVRGQRTYD